MVTRHRGFTRKKFLEAVGLDLVLHFLRDHRQLAVQVEDLTSAAKPVPDDPGVPPPSLDTDKVDKLLMQLPAEQQREVGEDFQCINDVADKGMDYIINACHEFDVAMPDDWPNECLSMLLFLDYPLAFRMAYDLYSWRASSNTMSHFQFSQTEAVVDDEAIGLFKASAEAFFHDQGKGGDCQIRHYPEDDGSHLLLVARGDHIQALSVWEGGTMRTTFPRPVREDLLRYDPRSGVLSIKAYGRSGGEVNHYVEAWTTQVLGRDQAELFTQTVVSLDPIKTGSFHYEGNEEIEWIRLLDLRFTLYGSKPMTIRIASEDVVNSLNVDLRSIRLNGATLRSAKLAFKLNYDGASAKPVLVEVTPPNVTRMNRKKDEDIINSYLRAEGILLA